MLKILHSSIFFLGAALATATPAQSTQANNGQLKIILNGTTMYSDYQNWSGHPYLKLQDTAARFGWYPQVDSYHNTVDIARCLRLDYNTNEAFRVDSHVLVGKNTISFAQKLAIINPEIKRVQSNILVPVDSVANLMGYKTKFFANKNILEITSPKNPQYGLIEYSCQSNIKNPEGT